jgi:hypothetical protein
MKTVTALRSPQKFYGNKIELTADGILYKGTTYPVAGAHAVVNDVRSGLFGRKHTTELVIDTSAGQIIWHDLEGGSAAARMHNKATAFAAAVNTAALTA